MTLRSRLMLGLVTVLVLSALTPSSFGQVNIQVVTDPSPGEISTARNAQTASPGVVGDGILVSGQLVAPSPLTTTVLRLTFPAAITSSPASFTPAPGIPAGDPIRIEGQTGVFAGLTNASVVLNTTNRRVEVTLPGTAPADTNTLSGSFRVVGTRIDVNGLTGAQSVTPGLDSGANNYILTTSSATVISALNPGIGGFAIGAMSGQTSAGSATIFTNRSVPDATGSLLLSEGFREAWRTKTQNANSATGLTCANCNSTQIRVTFNGVPAGVTLTLSTLTSPTLTVSLSNTSITSTANTTVVNFLGTSFASSSGVSGREEIQIVYAITPSPLSSTASVSTPGTITATATLFPIGDGVNNNNAGQQGLPREDQGYPSFAQLDSGPVTIVNIVAANTTLLVPYALVLAPFDTGLAIANTTADPFGAGSGGATPSSGTVTVNFFPTATAGGAGTSFSLTTSSTVRPGAGLSSDGTVAPGAVWTVLLSQLLTAAGQTGNFVGYIFVQTNFLNGHGVATISDFRTYSLAANVLVLPPPATSPRSNPGGSVESLGN